MDRELFTEKQDFTFIKEKIIKSNEVLSLYNEKNEKLNRATQAFKALKAKYEVALLEANAQKMANERLSDSLEVLKPKCENAEQELAAVRSDYVKLEEKYQEYLIETQLITTELQEKKPANEKIRELKQMCNDLKNAEHKLRIENNSLMKKNKSLEATNFNQSEKLHKELAEVKAQLQKAKLSLNDQDSLQNNHKTEIRQLKMDISRLLLENTKLKLLENECNTLRKQLYDKSTKKRDCASQTEQIIEQHRCKASSIVPPKGVKGEEINDMQTIREMEDDSLDMDISFSDIFREMILPRTIVSPMRLSSESAAPTHEETATMPLPNIIITPPTPNIESNNSLNLKFPILTDLPEVEELQDDSTIICNNVDLDKETVTIEDNVKKTTSTIIQNVRKPRCRRKFWMPYGINTFVKRKPIKTSPCKNDTILDALKILRQNNLNFTISSNSISLEPAYGYPIIPQPKQEPNTFTYKMDCFNKSCNTKNNLMMLQMTSQQEEPELLGFFSVKDEVIVPFKSEKPVEQKPHKSDLHQLAEEIIKGIKELTQEKQKKRKRHRTSEFNSETESELERLFRTSNNVLGRNRRLMAVARKQNLGSIMESDSDFMVDSGLVTATPKNDSDSLSFCSDSNIAPVVSPLKNLNNIKLHGTTNANEDSIFDSYKTPVCPLMISPLSASIKSSPEENRKVNESMDLGQLYFTDRHCDDTGQIKPIFCQKISFDDSSRGNEIGQQECSTSSSKINQASVIKLEELLPSNKCSERLENVPIQLKENNDKPSLKDLFGELSTSNSSDGEEKVPPKPASKKPPQKKARPLRSKILKQVRGLVYTYGNKGCDKSSCTKPKPVEVLSSKKINVVQNIVISKGHMTDSLLAPTSLRKRLKLDSSTATTTPVDILTKVMQTMTKTAPKKQISSKLPTVDSVEIAKPNYYDWDCPKSPDIVEVPDKLPKLIPTEKPSILPPHKVIGLIDKLTVFCNEGEVLEEVVKEFAFQDVDYIIRVLLSKLSKDIHDKPTRAFEGRPPMTNTQRILLGFLVKMEKSTHPGILDKFLAASEMLLFNKSTCELHSLQPITRLYTGICRMRMDLHRLRRFVCDSFYFAGDFAVPILYTVLVMWPDVLPLQSDVSNFPMAKVLVQLFYLKQCNMPGYNLMPLRNMLNKYYGYPTERWSCEEVFEEILVKYIQNPSIRLSDFTVLLFLKNKPAKWVHKKIKENIMPLYQMVPESNPNLKATLVILMANICFNFDKRDEFEWSVICEMNEWFQQLQEVETNPIVQNSLHLAKSRLPKMPKKKKKQKEPANANNGVSKEQQGVGGVKKRV